VLLEQERVLCLPFLAANGGLFLYCQCLIDRNFMNMVQANPLVVHKASLEATLGSLLRLVAGSSTSCTTLIMCSHMRTVTVIICLLVMYLGSKSLSVCSGLLACLLTADYNPVFLKWIPTLCSNFHTAEQVWSPPSLETN
jgi:hypothetical protein